MALSDDLAAKITEALMGLLSQTPASKLPPSADPPRETAKLVTAAARKAAAVSGALAVPIGPLGMVTVLPDLLIIWRIQQQMVADIAAIHGQTAVLNERTMAYCLFKHSSTSFVRDLVARAGSRYLVRRATGAMIQRTLKRLGIRVAQRLLGKTVSRFIPLIGAAAVAGYAYYDTTKVAGTAAELFSREVVLE
jgi:hypothetical protein